MIRLRAQNLRKKGLLGTRYNMTLVSFYSRIHSILSNQAKRRLGGDGLKEMLSAARGPELEQSALRVLIAGIVLAYLTWYVFHDGEVRRDEAEVLAVAVGFFLFGVGLTLRVLTVPHGSAARRFVGMIADNAVTTFCLIQMGEGGALVLFVYLFITFGNGIRFGRLYLLACQLMGIAGFALVLSLSPFWSQHLAIDSAFLLALLILPIYVGVLAERIKRERNRADEANQAKGRFVANVSH